jgi:uncharacterized protein YhfF
MSLYVVSSHMKIGLYLDDISMQVLKKGVFVSCEPMESIEALAPGLPDERMSEIGQIYLVANMEKETQGKAKLVDAFVTTFGQPDPRLIEIVGFRDDSEKFRAEYGNFYRKQFPNVELGDETELFVTIYEPIKDS